MLVNNKSFYLLLPFPIQKSSIYELKLVLVAGVRESNYEVLVTQGDRFDWLKLLSACKCINFKIVGSLYQIL